MLRAARDKTSVDEYISKSRYLIIGMNYLTHVACEWRHAWPPAHNLHTGCVLQPGKRRRFTLAACLVLRRPTRVHRQRTQCPQRDQGDGGNQLP